MENKKISLLIGIILIIGILAGCGSKTESGNRGVMEGKIVVCQGNYCTGEEGVLVLDNSGIVMFYDAATDQYVPLCAKPSCKHETTACAAVSIGGRANWILYHDGRLYYDCGENHDLYSADMDGKNERKIGNFGHNITVSPMIAMNHKLYVIPNDDTLDEEGYLTAVTTQLLEVNLESGEIRELTEAVKQEIPNDRLIGHYQDHLYYVDRRERALYVIDPETGAKRLEAENLYQMQAMLSEELLVYIQYQEDPKEEILCEKNLKTGETKILERRDLEQEEEFWLDYWDNAIKTVSLGTYETGGLYRWNQMDEFEKIRAFLDDDSFIIKARYGDVLIGESCEKSIPGAAKTTVESYLSDEIEIQKLERPGK